LSDQAHDFVPFDLFHRGQSRDASVLGGDRPDGITASYLMNPALSCIPASIYSRPFNLNRATLIIPMQICTQAPASSPFALQINP
jgi:hypothetical protein